MANGEWNLAEDEEPGAPESSWELEQEIQELYDKTIDELLGRDYPEGQTFRIGVRYFPGGLLSWWDELTEKHARGSLGKVQKATIAHGASILCHNSQIKELVGTYKARRAKVKKSKSRTAIVSLEKRQQVEFVAPSPRHTTVAILERTEGYISKMASILGIRENVLIMYLALLSLATSKQPNDWKEVTGEELKRFWKVVKRRMEDLVEG